MVKHLILVRHAEAATAVPGQKDHERPLTTQGYQDAARVGRYGHEQHWSLDIILSSDALRTRTTAKLIAEQLRFDLSRIVFREELYQASVRSMLQEINQQPDHCQQLMLVGHNPTISYLVEYLTRQETLNMAPAGVVGLTFNFGQWATVSKQTATLAYALRPADIV